MASPAAVLVPFVEPDKIIRFPRQKLRSVRPARGRRFRQKPTRPKKDFDILFPEPGKFAFHSPARFRVWASDWVRNFIEASFSLPEVVEVEVDTFTETATLSFGQPANGEELLKKLAQVFRGDLQPEARAVFAADVFRAIPKSVPRLRTFRHGETISTWQMRHEGAGLIRLRNALILNKPNFVQRLERALLGLAGVDYFKFHPFAGTLTVSSRISMPPLSRFRVRRAGQSGITRSPLPPFR
jgi:hypothetical protein